MTVHHFTPTFSLRNVCKCKKKKKPTLCSASFPLCAQTNKRKSEEDNSTWEGSYCSAESNNSSRRCWYCCRASATSQWETLESPPRKIFGEKKIKKKKLKIFATAPLNVFFKGWVTLTGPFLYLDSSNIEVVPSPWHEFEGSSSAIKSTRWLFEPCAGYPATAPKRSFLTFARSSKCH